MAKQIAKEELVAIENALSAYPEGAGLREIANVIKPRLADRALQYRLRHLVSEKRVTMEGERRWVKYRLASMQKKKAEEPSTEKDAEALLPLSSTSKGIRKYLRQPSTARKPVGYSREFLDRYRPNKTFYLSATDRARLAEAGKSNFEIEAAGTYAKQILNRLLIDLSWNSSRLEGNTYSLLDTRRLIEFGEEAQGRDRLEAQMIINHKDAIAFLVNAAQDIGFNRYTILNLHGILAHNLLADQSAAGRLRHIAIGIEKSTFLPLALPQLIEEQFNELLVKASAIEDPFEQALFSMVQLPSLQPFDDVNKRVSRLAANIPFIKRNLSPLSFVDVPRTMYTDAVLAIYELNKIDLLKDVFMWAYERSAARYVAVRQSIGEPDPFRFKYSSAIRQLIGDVVRNRMDRRTAGAHIASWVKSNIAAEDRERFREMAEAELLGLHEGNFARYQIRPSEFAAWQTLWSDQS